MIEGGSARYFPPPAPPPSPLPIATSPQALCYSIVSRRWRNVVDDFLIPDVHRQLDGVRAAEATNADGPIRRQCDEWLTGHGLENPAGGRIRVTLDSEKRRPRYAEHSADPGELRAVGLRCVNFYLRWNDRGEHERWWQQSYIPE